jgi:cyanate lyase
MTIVPAHGGGHIGTKRAKMTSSIGLSEVFTTSAYLGMNALPKDKAEALVNNLGALKSK